MIDLLKVASASEFCMTSADTLVFTSLGILCCALVVKFTGLIVEVIHLDQESNSFVCWEGDKFSLSY